MESVVVASCETSASAGLDMFDFETDSRLTSGEVSLMTAEIFEC